MEQASLIHSLAAVLAPRLRPFAGVAAADGLLAEGREAELAACAFLITQVVRPCCCALCRKEALEELVGASGLCPPGSATCRRLAELAYLDLCRLNGLG